MIAIDPSSRPTFDSLLHNARGTVFPETFYSFLHNYVASINELSSSGLFSTSVQATQPATTPTTINTPATTKGPVAGPSLGMSGDISHEPLPSDSDHRLERIWSDYESVEPYLLQDTETEHLEEIVKEPVKVEYVTTGEPGKPFQVCNRPWGTGGLTYNM